MSDFTTAAPLRILIVDDHPIVRQGYESLIGKHADLAVCASVSTEQEALEEIARTRPHVAIIDITLKESSGVELVKAIHRQYDEVKMLVISAHDENLYAERMLEVGALGYVNKQEAAEKLVEAIRKVGEGEVFVSPQIARRLLKRRAVGSNGSEPTSTIHDLTDRELQVYEMIGGGETTKYIANRLELSPKTVERYKENIKRKLGVRNATELVQSATRWILEKG